MIAREEQQITLYEQDYLRWLENTVDQLQKQNYAHVDWNNLIEEIEDMGKRERRALESNLIVVLVHLLKWQYQPECRTGSWAGSIVEHRRCIKRALQDSPSLKSYLEDIVAESYADAVKQTKAETGLPLTTFPTQCLYELSDILEDEFLPM